MQVVYTASATSTGEGRSGHVRSSDGVLDFDLVVPKEMGGPGGPHTNPEELFAAGYAGCFHNALKRVGRRNRWTSPGPPSLWTSGSDLTTTETGSG